jgi:hypothetical protein
MRRFFSAVAFLLFAGAAFAQTNLPTQSVPASNLTANPPAPCVSGNSCGATLWRCTGAATACPASGSNWTQIGSALTSLVSGTPAPFPADTTGAIGTAYTYVIVYTQGTQTAWSTNTYTGTPTALPLASGTISGSTS